MAELFLEIGPFSFAVLSLYFCVVAPGTWEQFWRRGKVGPSRLTASAQPL
jgi:hypothetical protein